MCESDENHPILGNIKQALEGLVQQRLELPSWVDLSLDLLIEGVSYTKMEHRHLYYSYIVRFLQKEKTNGPEGNTLFYELAERALDAPISERVKDYISQVF